MGVLDSIRSALLTHVEAGTSTVVAFQKACGVYLHPIDCPGQFPETPSAAHRPIPRTHSTGFEHVEVPTPYGDETPLQSATKAHKNGNSNGNSNGHSNGNSHGNSHGNSNGKTLKQRLVKNGHPTTVSPNTPTYTIHYRRNFLHFWFTAASGLGNEEFYILFLPVLFWCVDVTWARKIISMWVTVYYVGQFIKDLLLLPRPPSPPVAHLETHYSAEYGLPSTHAMIGLCMPFYLLHVTYGPNSVYPYWLGFFIAVVWVTSICLSRLYNGVHSVADIIAGLFLGVWILAFHTTYGEQLDELVVHTWWWPPFSVAFALVLVASYPRPEKWTNAMGDTTLIIAVGVGVYFGCSRFFSPPHQSLPFRVDTSSIETCIKSILTSLFWFVVRAVVGTACILPTKAITKKLSLAILTPILLPNKPADVDPNRVYKTEIPTKLIVYTAIGYTTTHLCFIAFDFLGV